MFIIVEALKNLTNTFVKSSIRTEDICEIYQDPSDSEQCIIEFYIQKEDMIVKEDFETLQKRVSDLEIEYYYDTSRDFGDEDFRNKLIEDENNEI